VRNVPVSMCRHQAHSGGGSPDPVTVAPAPPEFLEQVNAMAALAQLLSSANSTAAANALKPGVADSVRRVNQAILAVMKLSGAARDAADQHNSELEVASLQLRRDLLGSGGCRVVHYSSKHPRTTRSQRAKLYGASVGRYPQSNQKGECFACPSD
jgi:hypothetical protein